MTAGDIWFSERFARPDEPLMPRADAEPLERVLALAIRPVERVVDVRRSPRDFPSPSEIYGF